MRKFEALVLLSGGLDSVYNLYAAHRQWSGAVLALHIQYGQKAAVQELKAAQFFCQTLQVPLRVLDLASLFGSFTGALTSAKSAIPKKEVDIHSQQKSEQTAAQVWVPNRNGVFLNVAAAVAENESIGRVVPGFNREEAATFADNSAEFLALMNQCLSYSTRTRVKVECFSIAMDKSEIFKQAQVLAIDFNHLWSCYQNGERPCGECESCQRFQRGLNSIKKEG